MQSLKIDLNRLSLWDSQRIIHLCFQLRNIAGNVEAIFLPALHKCIVSLFLLVFVHRIFLCILSSLCNPLYKKNQVCSWSRLLLFTIKEKRVSKRSAMAIRLIHTVRNINYLLSLVTAISIIIHKPLDIGCKKSSGFGLKPHWKAIHLAIHSKASE